MRAYKTVNDTYIEPISFTVPRRSEVFQSDIYPPAVGTKPGLSASDWLSGKNGLPAKIDLESIYEGNAPAEVAADYKPPTKAPAPAAAPAKAPEPKKEEPAPVQKAPASMADQKVSMSAMASKFQDNDDEEDEDDASSFEEIPKPVVRHSSIKQPEPTKASSPAAKSPITPTPAKASPAPVTEKPAPIQTSPGPISAVGSAPSGGVSSGVESALDQIKKMLELQTKTITEQNEKIGQLTSEVNTLKLKIGSSAGGQDQSERIRQLELELEAARS